MKKQITAILICFLLVISMFAVALPVSAAGEANTLFATPNKTETFVGDTVNYTVYIGPVEHLNSGGFTLVIPTGLTFQSYQLASGIESKLGAEKVKFNDATLTFAYYGEGDFTSANDTALMSFTCKVNNNAALGDYTVIFANDADMANTDFETLPGFKCNNTLSKVTVKSKPIAVNGVTLNKTALTLNTGESETLSATVTPGDAANKNVTWYSNNVSVAAIDNNGKVTANKKGTAVITVTTADGNKTATCTVTVNCTHTMTKTEHPAVTSTCQVQGNNAYTTCDGCGEVVIGSDAKLPLAPHNCGTLIPETPATVDTDGVKAHYECSVCHKNFADKNGSSEITDLKIPKLGHNISSNWTYDKENHWHTCSCEKPHDKAAHTWGAWSTVTPATETTEGSKKRECTICHYAENEVIPVIAHTHSYSSEWSKNDSFHWHNCSGCTEKGSEAAHDWNITITKEATHTEDGIKTYTCKVCGYTKTEPVAKTEHSYSTDWKHNDTQHWHECSCGVKNGEAAHTWGDWATVTPATETTEGSKKRECTACHYEETGVIPVSTHTHNYSSDWSKNDSFHWHDCSGCNEKGSEAPHTFGEWTVTKAATEAEKGEKKRTCVCGYAETEEIEIGHTHSFGSDWKRSDTEHWHECACGEKTDKAAHSYDADGKCVCGAENAVIPSIGDGKITVDGFEFEVGNKLPEGAQIIVNKIDAESEEGKAILNALAGMNYNSSKGVVIFDIHALKDGIKVQPNGTITVTLDKPIADVDNYVIYHIKDDGSIETLYADAENGKISFNISSFSSFVFAEKSDNAKEPKKGLSAGAIVAIVIASVLVIEIVVFVIFWFVIKKKSWADFLMIFKRK